MAKHLLRILLALTISITLGTGLTFANMPAQADRVVVNKSNRLLALYQGEQIIRTYPISLGKNPTGHKVRRGDKRTPEGHYKIDWRNPDSRYHKALHISYPNPRDRRQASRLGFNPGGSIMLHGLPPKYADGENVLLDLDWTDGCIAVSNQAIEEIWQMVADNTVIEIWP